MKTPFTLEAWLKDKSQKVVEKDGRPVRIICTDADGLYPIIGLVDNKTPLPCGKDGRPPYIGGGGGTLFLDTAEPELSEFEKAVGLEIFDEPFEEKHIKVIKEESAKLLNLARKELREELQMNKDSSDSFIGLAISSAYERGKAESLKDLPRWKKAGGHCFVGPSIMYDDLGFYKSSTTKPGCRYITYESLRVLPGFNE